MGMSIDKTIEFFDGLECHTPQAKDAKDVAIETMRKYQKIERIIEIWHQDIYAKDFECIAEVAEVVEDGKKLRKAMY